MNKRFAALGMLIFAICVFTQVHAQDAENTLKWSHGLTFKVRPAGVNSFKDPKVIRFGAEVFNDTDLKKGAYVLETGAVGVGAAEKLTGVKEPKAPLVSHALELRARKPGEAEFKTAKKFGIELFTDVNADNLIYVTESGSIASLPKGSIKLPEEGKVGDPEWYHGMELKVRKAGEKEFDNAKKLGLEVYKDPNTNQLIYVSIGEDDEKKRVIYNGAIAAVDAGETPAPEEVKTPVWYYAFEIKVRKADEKEFGENTQAYGVEVYKDENANNLIFVCETGSIAVVSAEGVTQPKEFKDPTWEYGRMFRVRRHDEPDFNDKTQRFGAEVYKDEISKKQIYITDKGWISIVR